jgi:hypothetical protein
MLSAVGRQMRNQKNDITTNDITTNDITTNDITSNDITTNDITTNDHEITTKSDWRSSQVVADSTPKQ